MIALSLQEELDRLGRLEPDAIARTFRRLGITGTPGYAASCPVANYLRRRGIRAPRIGRWEAHDSMPDLAFPPENVSEFIGRFDSGNHYKWISE